eukprot:scaffold7147_cov130-Isochrysis_galbana.AAC.2
MGMPSQSRAGYRAKQLAKRVPGAVPGAPTLQAPRSLASQAQHGRPSERVTRERRCSQSQRRASLLWLPLRKRSAVRARSPVVQRPAAGGSSSSGAASLPRGSPRAACLRRVAACAKAKAKSKSNAAHARNLQCARFTQIYLSCSSCFFLYYLRRSDSSKKKR